MFLGREKRTRCFGCPSNEIDDAPWRLLARLEERGEPLCGRTRLLTGISLASLAERHEPREINRMVAALYGSCPVSIRSLQRPYRRRMRIKTGSKQTQRSREKAEISKRKDFRRSNRGRCRII